MAEIIDVRLGDILYLISESRFQIIGKIDGIPCAINLDDIVPHSEGMRVRLEIEEVGSSDAQNINVARLVSLHEPIDSYACDRCGRRDGLDTVVPIEIWQQISPAGDESGLLCLWCIDAACAEKGIECSASLHFAGRAITGTSQSEADREQIRRACERREKALDEANDAAFLLTELVMKAVFKDGEYYYCVACDSGPDEEERHKADCLLQRARDFLRDASSGQMVGRMREAHQRVLDAILKHYRQRGNDRCWENDLELYAAIDIVRDGSAPELIPIENHRLNCDQYRANEYDVPVEQEPCARLARLEKLLAAYRAKRSVDGGGGIKTDEGWTTPARPYMAPEHWRAELEIELLEAEELKLQKENI